MKYEVREPFLDIRKAFDPGQPQLTDKGNVFFYDPYDHRKVTQGRRGRGLREGRRDRQGLLPPERDRAGPDRAAGLPGRARERRPADRLHLHPGDVLHDGRARRAPATRARQHQARRRHGRRRLRRQGRLRHRAARRDPRAQGPPPGALDLHARGGDALRQRARLLARRDGRRAHQGRLDPRPQGADAARRRRLHALLELRRDEALVPPGRRLHGAGTAHAAPTSSGRTTCRRPPCAASA